MARTSSSTSPLLAAAAALLIIVAATLGSAQAARSLKLNGYLDQFTKQSPLADSFVAGSNEGNPYGFVPIPTSLGLLKAGNFLVTNW